MSIEDIGRAARLAVGAEMDRKRYEREGPHPAGVAYNLRRERDEARAERDALYAEVERVKTAEARYWGLIWKAAQELKSARTDGLVAGITLSLASEMLSCYVADAGDFEDLPDWFTSLDD